MDTLYNRYIKQKAIIFFFPMIALLTSCGQEKEHIAPAIHDRDSVSVMTTYGVNTLVSDSGVIKYRIVTERWDVNTIKQPTRWTFIKGLFLEQFDERFKVQAYIQADTAWYYDQKKLWELRGRVRIKNIKGLVFTSEELFWDGIKHELYSNKFSRLVTPERTLQGSYFESDERMSHYMVSNTKGSFVKSDMDDSAADTTSTDTSSVIRQQRPAQKPRAAKPKVPTDNAPNKPSVSNSVPPTSSSKVKNR